MLSRALSLATVTLLIGGLAAGPAYSQATNLEAGKSPSQIFAGTCTACHKGPRGLLRTVPAGSLPGFLRQHYTTSSEMASLLSAFLISNGATDTRFGAGQAKQAKDAKSEGKPGGPEQLDRQGRRLRPGAAPQEAAKPEERPQQAAKPDTEEPGLAGRHGRKSAASKRGRPGSEEPPKADTARTEPSTGEPASEEKPKGEAAREEGSKPGEAKPEIAKPEIAKPEPAKSETAKSETVKVDAPKAPASGEPPVLRADPVPPVTPAPPAPPAVASGGPPEPAAASSPPAPSATAPPAPPAVTASMATAARRAGRTAGAADLPIGPVAAYATRERLLPSAPDRRAALPDRRIRRRRRVLRQRRPDLPGGWRYPRRD